jgi:hypothetical protein
MCPRRSTAHPTDAYTAKPLAIPHHTPLVHRALHRARYCERYRRHACMTAHQRPMGHWEHGPEFPAPLDSTPDWLGYGGSAGDPSSHPPARLAVHCDRYRERHRKPERHHRKRYHREW